MVAIPVQRDACRLGLAQDAEEVGWQGGRHGLFFPWTDIQNVLGASAPKPVLSVLTTTKARRACTIAEAGVVPQPVSSTCLSRSAEAWLRRPEDRLRHQPCLRVIVDPLGFFAPEATEDAFLG